MSKTYFVRLKPFNKRKGHLVRNYMTGGVRFTTRWKEVSPRFARKLEAMCQPHDKEAEIPLFDIKTEAEALAIEEKERDEGKGKVHRVRDAEVTPDSAFRDDRPKLNAETGEIESTVERAEIVVPKEPEPEPDLDLDQADADDAPAAAPAPSLRGGKGKAKTRS